MSETPVNEAPPKPPRFEQLLARLTRAGVYRLPRPADHAALDAAAETLGFAVFRVDLGARRDKDGLLGALAGGLDFPAWFGHNWDALTDCLSDLSWQPGKGYVLLLEHADALAGSAAGDFATALTILQDAADNWREQGLPFWTLIELADGSLVQLPELD
jgi:hypothetical protein